MNIETPPAGILDPQQPWYRVQGVSAGVWSIFKAKLTGGTASDGISYSSSVNLTEADADKLIENIKKYGQYPQVNHNGKYGGYENFQKYQEWLVEEFLEKPFREETNKKIEDAATESRLKEIDEQRKKENETKSNNQEKAKAFISRATSFRPGKRINAKVSKVSGLIPKRTVPKELVDKISTPTESETSNDNEARAPKKVISTLGKLTLDLVQIENNLDKIREVILEDYKSTREINKKETDEYKKTISKRGSILGKRELKDNKIDLKDLVKKFVGGFFSGAGGAIRSLALFNLMEGALNGNPQKVISSLLGIGATFLPAIGVGIAGSVIKNLGKGLFGGGSRAVQQGAGGIARGAGAAVEGGGGLLKGVGKFGGRAAVIGGGLLLGSKLFGMGGGDEQEQRLEELTQEQKGSSAEGLMPQDQLKRFDDLNKRFEKILDGFGKGEKARGTPAAASSGGGKGGEAPPGSGEPPVPSPGSDPLVPIEGTKLTGLTDEDYKYLGYAISGEAGPGQDMYGVAASILNRVASGRGSVKNVVLEPGQYDAVKRGMTSFSPQIENLLKSPEGQALLVAALQRLQGRTDFKGQALLRNRNPNEDPMFDSKGNYYHYGYQTGPNSKPPPGWSQPNWKRFVSNAQQLPAGSRPGTPSSVSPTTPSAARGRVTTPPSSNTPIVMPIPVSAGKKDSPPISAAQQGNNVIPSVSTTYSNNFLTLYSRLVYQIV